MPDTGDGPQTLQHVRGGSLSADTTRAPGMQRYEAISGTAFGCEKL